MSPLNLKTQSILAADNAVHVADLATVSREDFQRLSDALVAHHCPLGPVERRYVDMMAVARWRQIQTTNMLMDSLLPHLASTGKSAPALLRYQKSLIQQFDWARRTLAHLQGNR